MPNRYLVPGVQVRNSDHRSRMNIPSFGCSAPRHDHEHSGVRVQATWHGTVLADSDRTIIIEGNHYFPPEDVSTEYLTESGQAHHLSVEGRGQLLRHRRRPGSQRRGGLVLRGPLRGGRRDP